MPLKSAAALDKDTRTARSVTLQHRHFAFIASVIASLPIEYREEVALAFERELMRTNPKFDNIRFQQACRAWE